MRKVVSVLLCVSLLFIFGCGKKEVAPVKKLLTPQEWSSTGIYQLQPPPSGADIAILHTTMGDIKIRFFEQEAPKAVKNFITLSNQGYYKDNIFFKVENDGYILTGDRTGSGNDGMSSYIAPFEDEFSPKLHAYRGAVMMNHVGANGNLSQFSIMQCKNVSKMHLDDMKTLNYPQEVQDTYTKLGGVPLLDNKTTVFGQVIEGMDVVDKIASVPVDENQKPKTPIKMTSIEIVKMP
ncbi:MAG: peptidylprolyl isomerase [Candidatus Saccharibacteria bacterium]